MAESKKVNVGVVGFGMSAQTFHCPLIVSSPHMNLVAVVERRSTKSQSAYAGITTVTSTDDLFAMGNVDLVVITTPNGSHFDLAKQAMEKGKHVIVEKPFTVTSQEAELLVQVSKETGKVLSVYQNRRWDGDFLTVKKLIEQGYLGRLVEFESHFDRFRNFSKNGWREQETSKGAGMLYDLGAHLIDQANNLFGVPHSIYATISNQRQLPGANIDDDFIIILTYKEGHKALLRSSMLARQTPVLRYSLRGFHGSYVKHHLDVQEDQLKAGKLPGDAGYGTDPREHWGTLNSDLAGGVHVDGKVETVKGNYLAFYNNVAEAILFGKPLAVTPEDGLLCMRLIELAQKSSDEGRTIFF
ncbi:NAD(P)-binding protein [Hesseltinella vesiculosa]|uniref:NAD(P)-binding protein n=1 Tax=Hesseltinella vesiculosa TaxID=101127 RepID=A0A1X2G679_9FUNG|nr:NAD(P)-binding protein [Hesseltinella vesiculosa]